METVTSMTRVCSEIRRTVPTRPLGIQILTGWYYMRRFYYCHSFFMKEQTRKPLQWLKQLVLSSFELRGLCSRMWQMKDGLMLALGNS